MADPAQIVILGPEQARIITTETPGETLVVLQYDAPTGPQGDSAYQAWLDLGNEGSEADFIDSLRASGAPITIDGGNF